MGHILLLATMLLLWNVGGAEAAKGHALAMHGTPKYGPDFKHFDYVNPDAPKGGTVRRASTGGFDSFNPFIIKGEAAIGLGLTYDTLTETSHDEPFTHYGLLAETIETPEDRSWVQFTLRKEARWHDGKTVTADDVLFSFNMLREKGAPFYRFYYASVERAEKIDERTVKFVFKPGDNRELPLILGQLSVLPKHYWETRDFNKTTLEPPLGSGPYRIKSFEAGRRIVYGRVADYWGKDIALNVGRHNFDEISYDYYRDRTVQLEAFKAGAFDFRVENSSKNWATAYDVPAVNKGLLVKDTFKHSRSSGIQGFVFNTRRDIFTDKRVRQALTYAFDFEWSNKNLFYSQYRRTRSFFDNSELAAKGLPGKDELEILEPFRGKIPDEVFTKEYQPPETDGTGRIRSNLRIADKLLKDAGWVIKDQKRVHAETGAALDFTITLVSPEFERISLPFAKNLKRLGVEARVRTVDTAQYLRLLETFDFDMITFVWGQSLSPGNEQRNFWGSAAATQKGSRNFIGINDPIIDELIEKLIAAPDRESLVAHCRALDRVLQWGHYLVPQFHLGADRIAYWDVFGRPKITPQDGAQFDAWWIVPEKETSVQSGKKALKPE
ncbi:MAG: ABC transporter substrate-binding protein [Rhodospirillales bacterium]|nr:ABC transporter substrate-binding protein [Rhodospirillales bacterium]